MRKIVVIFECFGVIKGIKYILVKTLGLVMRLFFKVSGRRDWLARKLKRIAAVTDTMVEDYIYNKYKGIYDMYDSCVDNGEIPVKKIIWTAWLQGEGDLPRAVQESFNSMIRNSGSYQVVVITLENVGNYLNVEESIIEKFRLGKLSAAHFTDYIRVCLLKEYGGIWLDATQYLIRPFSDTIWDEDLLLWNSVRDVTGKNLYSSIPFVEKFNNSFLVGKKDGLFYQFAVDITEKILLDPIIEIDYFANFKGYFSGFKHITTLRDQWEQMGVINPYGLITRQTWNSQINERLKGIIHDPQNLFFMLTYKKQWRRSVKGKMTVQEYIVEEFR
ncbi:capsular polysaccharide synthesis protein [Levilactobacillus suantsaiihabitans]|uniref:Methanolan biosynthesis protein EpsI n=1 Tax=Levilactobacillus suantsaiihabitans TaxID=2487722 RepID=A0A4Z0JAV7_9LACO|nr:capsular polysaccharide synthesis protein [Levilactobacillus suantsaiihabitans]TGD18605.1 methanolan biosynthesis protein EpsI [Levilactobacillus suantsaiihabitans]